MMRPGMALLALMWTGPADARMCLPDVGGPALPVRVCVAGACEKTLLDYTSDCARWVYHNGLVVENYATGTVAFKNGKQVDISQIECVDLEADACFIIPGKKPIQE